MAADLVSTTFSGIVTEGAKALFEPIMRQISYVFKYQSYIAELKVQVKELEYKRERVGIPVREATQQRDEIYKDVADWLNNVDEFISEGVAKSIIDDEDRAKKSCFKGFCPNLISRYKLSKQAAKAAEAAASLVGKGNFSSVSHRPAPESTEHMQAKDFEAFDSRMKLFQDVVEALRNDKLNIIGVHGMGGVGKTTLVKQIAKQVMEDKVFDKVVMAEVTENPDVQKIQDKLASDLDLNFDLNDSKPHRAKQLCQRLTKEKRVLIILDNIWKKLGLEEIGIPFGDVDEKDRKQDLRRRTIILTSRSKHLLTNDMNSQKIFLIEVLSKEEALQFFEKIVGNSAKASAFQPLADEIVGKCGGLPVALSTVANALKNKKLPVWKDALTQLRNSNPREIHGMDANVCSSIELSYNFLESDEAKSLFLLCTLFGEGTPIQVASLLRYGKGLFKNVRTLENARNRVDALIDNLKASCLLLDGDAEDEVKMHDVIHVVAVSIASEKLMFSIPNVTNLKEEIEKIIQKGAIAISIPYGDIQELPERLECPQLKLLLLLANGDSYLEISHLFFEGTEDLKVLSLSGIHFSSLSSSLGHLINLQTLCLDWCQLEDVAAIGQLKKLEILSFRYSDIKQLPLEIGQLAQLQLLDLSNCSSLVVIAPNVISKFSRLEELYMGDSFPQWDKVEGGSNASLAELKGLSKLTTLEIQVQDAQMLPQDLVFVELPRYRICIGEAWGIWRANSETSRLVQLHGLENVSTLLENYGMKMLLKLTEDIRLEELTGVQNVVHELDDGEGFPRLKHLWVERCSEILHIVGSVGRVHRKVFPLLESLSLYKLINLEAICHSQLREDQFFSNLKIIEVESCDKLKHLFSFSIARNLLRLQKVKVASCNKLEMTVGPDREKPTTSLGFNEIIADDDTAPKVLLPSLEELNLTELRNIKKLWADHNQGMYCCQNLTKLYVRSCDRMKYLFSYSMVNSLLQLQHLEIWSCESMEGVVDTTGWSERDEGKLIELKVFPKLHSLQLYWLTELTSFANTGHIHSDLVVEFPSLLNLEIGNCSNMLRFISTSSPEDTNHSEMQPPPLFDEKVGIPSSLVNLKVSKCQKIEEIVGHVGEEVKENRIAFSELKVLILNYLSRLTSFCLENYTLEFPSLERVSMIRCPNMKTFSQGILSIPKPCKVQVTEKEEGELHHWEGNNLNSIMQKYYKEMIGFRDIWYLQLSHFPRLKEIWHGQALPVSFFNNLARLVVDDCTNMSSAIPANLLRCLNNLRRLEVRNCDSLEEVLRLEELNADKEHIGPMFPKLSNLRLIDLPKLKRFCNFTGNIIELPELRYLTIENCPDMETFISNSTSVLHMTADNKEAQKLKSEENLLVAFPQLMKLKLSGLHKVQHLWKENAESNKVFANLKSLEIFECSKLQKLVPALWHLENLATLEVSKCHGLINLLTLSTSESLVNLERMKITDCKMMEEIIQSQVGEEAEDCIVFRKLEYLGIDCLPSLTSFSLGNYALEFPSLAHVVVRQCPTMKIFSPGVVDAPKLNKVKPTEDEDGDDEGCWEGNLNDTIKKLFNEMVSINEVLALSSKLFLFNVA
ncbi:Disease resistance protein [Citrus sinensis]|uniref:Disease resistance protein n=1 Tax=Citrus sinensis TaxID=2711 RepID=A0ACB8KF83_CITSI|nr:Disease resistance protein [Citrus sinensis]